MPARVLRRRRAAVSARRFPIGFAIPFNWLLGGWGGWTTDTLLAGMRAYGADYVRFDMWWDQVETTQGSFNWGPWDTVIPKIIAHGMVPVAILDGGPAWNGGLSNTTQWNNYATYCSTAVTRFKNSVHFWEMMNEPNLDSDTYSGGSSVATWLANYSGALKAASAAMRTADPGAKIITGGLSNVSDPSSAGGVVNVTDWLNGMYANGCKSFFDAVGMHPYNSWVNGPEMTSSWDGYYQLVNVLRPIMVSNGDSAKKIWATEWGWPTAGTSSANPPPSEATEATWMGQVITGYKQNAQPWMGPLMVYTFVDYGTNWNVDTSDNEDWFGVVHTDGSAKAATSIIASS